MSAARRRATARDPAAEKRRLARKARRRAGRRSAILAAARQVVLRGGLDGFTLSEVATAADVSKAAVLYYFESKEEIVAALVGEAMQAAADVMLDAVESADSGIEALGALVRAFVGHHAGDLESFRLFEAWTRSAGVQRRLLETSVYPAAASVSAALEARLRRDRRSGRLHRDAHPRRLANVAYFTAHGLVSVASGLHGLGGDLRYDLDELCEEACASLIRGAEPSTRVAAATGRTSPRGARG